MNREDISKQLGNIQPNLEGTDDYARKKALSQLLNIVEVLVTENEYLKAENQTLKDEINRLKGEQGKPDIKANKDDGDISSEKERLQAEETDEERSSKEGFKLDKNSLEKLKEQRLPIELLEQLEKMKGNKYSDETEFIKEIESIIGTPLTSESRSLLIKYARYKKRKRAPKLPRIIIDREVDCPVDTSQLPDDAEPKGYEDKIVQDVIIQRDNIKFNREVYYSPSLKKRFIGDVPRGYEGEFGPHIKASIISMKYVNGMSSPKIIEFYHSIGTIISATYITNQLTKPASMDRFHHEKEELHKAGLEVSSYIQIDDTGTRVNGQNHYTHIICNELYTVFFTTANKNRLTILDILRNFESRSFLLNNKTFSLLEQFKVSQKDRELLSEYQRETPYNESEIIELLQTLYGTGSPRKRTRIMEACAISHYHQETGIMVVEILVCDDAPQFKLLTSLLALCWIHEGRHYKRLNPVILIHQEKLAQFLKDFWEYYRKLAAYKKEPCDQQAELLATEFDLLFSTKTGYDDLDKRIEKSKNKKDELLVVLKHPQVPLHNNLSEGGARVEKRRQDVSLQTKTDEGTKAKDTMMSLVETCKKFGISAYEFIYDRVSGENKIPSLAEMIKAKVAGKLIPPWI
jgi:regulator of replication initiation timing